MSIIGFSILAVLFCCLTRLMVTDKTATGRYDNPNVASQVVRGTIYDRNGRALAMEVPQYNLYIKSDCDDFDEVSQILSLHLDLTPDAIKAKAARQSSNLVLLAKDISDSTMASIKEDVAKNNLHDCITIRKEYSRTFPAGFHASQLIEEVEKVYDNVLSPVPGYDQSTTYGNNVYLTVDLDIQYLLDLAVQQVYEIQQSEYCAAFVLDIPNAQMLACTTYPFYDLNDSASIPSQQKVSRTLVSSIEREDLLVSNISVIEKVTDYYSTTELSVEADGEFTKDLENIMALVNDMQSDSSCLMALPTENPRYAIFIASVGAKYYRESSILEYAIQSVEEGLISQGKI